VVFKSPENMMRALPDSGGISTFTSKGSDWAPNKTWILKKSTPLVSGLRTINDHGNHYLIAPVSNVALTVYVANLTALNSKAVRYDQQGAASEEKLEERILPAQVDHADRATRFLYTALAAVNHGKPHVEGWDENDYEYVATLAHALKDGTTPLSALVWNQEDGEDGWTKAKAFTAQAVLTHAAHEIRKAKRSRNEDDEADVANDTGYLRSILKLDDPKNPYTPKDV
jgi:hypothetical protein